MLRFAMFDVKPYDRPAFERHAKDAGIEIKFFETKLTADTVIIGVNTSDVAGSTVNVPVIYTQVYGKDDNNVIVVYENKGTYNEVVAIFVDENNSI